MTYQLIQLTPLRRLTRALMAELAPNSGKPLISDRLRSVPEGFAYVPIEERPPFDPDTQALARALTPEKDGWTITDLSPEEIAAKQAAATQAAADQTELAQIKAVYQDLKNGTGTAGERLTRVERVLARILRDTYGS